MPLASTSSSKQSSKAQHKRKSGELHSASYLPSDGSQVLPPRDRAAQHQRMLNSMEVKARALCDDTRQQYEILLQRHDTQHERQLLSLQGKLKDVLSSSISLAEHQEVIQDLAKKHQRELDEVRRQHTQSMAHERTKWKQEVHQQLKHQKDVQSAEKIALRDQEQASRKELDDARRANEQLQIRLQEACQHILSLKAQLPKIDQLKTKLKKEREQHAKSTDVWRTTEKELRQTIADLTCRVSVLESEAAHRKTITETQDADLSSLEHALTQRDGLIAELETALTDVTARVCLLEELRVVELTRFDQALQDANGKYTATIVALETAKAQVTRVDQSNRSMEMQLETSRRQMDAATTHHEHTQAALLHQLRHLHAKYAGAKRRSQAA